MSCNNSVSLENFSPLRPMDILSYSRYIIHMLFRSIFTTLMAQQIYRLLGIIPIVKAKNILCLKPSYIYIPPLLLLENTRNGIELNVKSASYTNLTLPYYTKIYNIRCECLCVCVCDFVYTSLGGNKRCNLLNDLANLVSNISCKNQERSC